MKFTATIINETARAICCRLNNDDINHWIPKSQMLYGSTVQRVGDTGTLVLSKWFVGIAKLPTSDGDIDY